MTDDNELIPQPEDYTPDLITLMDEDDNEIQFEIIDAIELEDDERYMAMVPVPETPQDMLEHSGDLVIFKVIVDGEDECFEEITDDEEFQRVSAIFVDRLSEEYEFEEKA